MSNACGAASIPGKPQVCISWTASTTPSVTYSVFRSTAAGGENYASPLNVSPITGTSYLDSTATAGTEYFYTIVAVLGGYMSAPSSEVSVQIPTPPAAPTAPVAAIV